MNKVMNVLFHVHPFYFYVSYAISRMITDFVSVVVCSTFGIEVKTLFCVVSKS